jgi:hypothetical protein
MLLAADKLANSSDPISAIALSLGCEWVLRHPPSASLYRNHFVPTEQSGSPKSLLATDCFWRILLI